MSIESRRTAAGALRYTVRIKHKGRTVAAQTFARKGDAETWEREQYRALQFGEFIAPSQSKRVFSEVVEEFLAAREGQIASHSWRTDRDNLANVPASWDRMPISAISERDILQHLTEELRTKAHSTVSRARTSLSALFQYAVRERMRLRNPVREVRMPAGLQINGESNDLTTWTPDALAETLTWQGALNPPLAEVVEFLSLTGLRWSELRALRVSRLVEVHFR